MKKLVYLGIALAGMLASSCCGPAKTDETQPVEKNGNAVIETIMARRSIRKYKAQPVEEEKLQEILKCGINAPTGMYKQSWQIRVVTNPELLAQIDKGFSAQRERNGKSGKARAFYGAPCLIFIAYDLNYDLSQVDCGLLGENVILAAQSMGLGTCCLGQVTRFMLSDDAKELYSKLKIPETHQLLYAISVGYADEMPDAKSRDMGRIKFIE